MMKKTLFIILVLVSATLSAQEKNKQKPQIVEVSCGQCQFGMTEKKGCDLAVRLDGKSYFVEGTTIDDHGDAHAHDGFCSTIRKAEVVGEIKGNRFVVSSFTLLPTEKK
jgi:Family of unknown function (DUF6370)